MNKPFSLADFGDGFESCIDRIKKRGFASPFYLVRVFITYLIKMQAPARIRIFFRIAKISLFPSKETKYYEKVKIKLGDIERRILVSYSTKSATS